MASRLSARTSVVSYRVVWGVALCVVVGALAQGVFGATTADEKAVKDALNQIKNEHMGLLPQPPDPGFANNAMEPNATVTIGGKTYTGFRFGNTFFFFGQADDGSGGRTFPPVNPDGSYAGPDGLIMVSLRSSHINGVEWNAKKIILHELVHVGQYRDGGSGAYKPDGSGGLVVDPGANTDVRPLWEVEAYLTNLKLYQEKLKQDPNLKKDRAFKHDFGNAIKQMQKFYADAKKKIAEWQKDDALWQRMQPLVEKYINAYAKLFCQKKAEWYSWDGDLGKNERQLLEYYMNEFGLSEEQRTEVKYATVNFWKAVAEADGVVDESEQATLDHLYDVFGISPDDTPPVATIVHPLEGEILTMPVEVLVEETSGADDAAALYVYVSADGVVWDLAGVDEDGADGWRVVWDDRSLPPGVYFVAAYLEDAAGNASAEDSVSFVLAAL